MNVYEIIFSPTGGTKNAARIIEGEFAENIKTIDLTDRNTEFEKIELSSEDVCFVAVPSFGGRAPETAINRIKMIKGAGAKAVAVCVYGNRAYEDTILELKNTLKESGFKCIAGVCAIAEHSIARQFAAGRPDSDDKNVLAGFADKIKEKINSGDDTEVQVPGNTPYKTYGGSAMKPETNDNCIACGLCAKKCPADAIIIDKKSVTVAEKCISCMKCIAVCPKKARQLDKNMVDGFAAKCTALFAVRRENELFI